MTGLIQFWAGILGGRKSVSINSNCKEFRYNKPAHQNFLTASRNPIFSKNRIFPNNLGSTKYRQTPNQFLSLPQNPLQSEKLT